MRRWSWAGEQWPVARVAMDLVVDRRRGYTVSVNTFLPQELSIDTAFEQALSADAPTAAAGAADATLRCVQVVADDPAAAARWCESLRGEGLVTVSDGRGPEPLLAVVLHVARRLPDQLGLLAPRSPRNSPSTAVLLDRPSSVEPL